MSKIVDNLIPNAPSDLCFNYKEFSKVRVHINGFLTSKHLKTCP